MDKAEEASIMTIYSLDTNVIISHLRGDRFANETDEFFRRAIRNNNKLVIPEVVYAELYTGIYLASKPKIEETRVQSLLAVNAIEVRTQRSLKVAKRAGELYAAYLKRMKAAGTRILPDYIIAAQAEAISEIFVTWNESDYLGLKMKIPVSSPRNV